MSNNSSTSLREPLPVYAVGIDRRTHLTCNFDERGGLIDYYTMDDDPRKYIRVAVRLHGPLGFSPVSAWLRFYTASGDEAFLSDDCNINQIDTPWGTVSIRPEDVSGLAVDILRRAHHNTMMRMAAEVGMFF